MKGELNSLNRSKQAQLWCVEYCTIYGIFVESALYETEEEATAHYSKLLEMPDFYVYTHKPFLVKNIWWR